MSKKHKTPWITYNDVDVADSQFCIEYLNEKFSMFLGCSYIEVKAKIFFDSTFDSIQT